MNSENGSQLMGPDMFCCSFSPFKLDTIFVACPRSDHRVMAASAETKWHMGMNDLDLANTSPLSNWRAGMRRAKICP